MAPTVNDRKAWDDKFTEPTVAALRGDLEEGPQELFDRFREQVKSIKGLSESFSWQGPSWRWTIAYSMSGRDTPVCMIVPSPTDLQLAMQIDKGFLDSLTSAQMKRSIREGLDMVQEPYDNQHAVWSLVTANVVDDLGSLIRMRVDHLGSRKKKKK